MSFVIPFFLAIAPVALAASSFPSSLSQFTSVWSNTTSTSSVSSVSAFSSAIPTSSAPLTSSVVLSTSSSIYLSLPSLAALSSSSSSSVSSSIAPICSSANSCLPSESSSSLALSAPAGRQSPSSLAANSSLLASSLSTSTNSTPSALPSPLLLSGAAVSNLPAKTSLPSLLLSLNASTPGPLSLSLSTPASQLSSSPLVKGYTSYPANLTIATALTSNVSTLSANTTGLHASNTSVPTSTSSSACSAYCTHSWPVVTTWAWVTANPKAPASKLWTATATVTATLVVIVDELTNTTQTSLVDNGPATSWQTVMTAKFLNGNLVLRGGSPVVLTFPTNYVDYGPSYTVSKAGKSSEPILPTNGACSHTTRYALPSHHPPLPQPIPSPVDTLPSQVWGLQLYSGDGRDSVDGFFKSQFPFEAAFQLCFPYNKTGGSDGPGPAAVISVASLTTVTATQTRTSNAKSSTSTPTANTPTPPVNSKPNPPVESTTTEDNPSKDGATQQPAPTDTRGAIVLTPPSETTSVISTDGTSNTIVDDGERTSTLEPPQNIIRPVTLSDNTLTVVTLPPATTTNPPTFDIGGQKLSVDGVVTLGSGPSTTIVEMATDVAGNTLLNVNGQISTISNPETPAAPPVVVARTTLVPIAGTSAAFSIGDSMLAVDRPVTLGIGSPSTTVLALSSDSLGNTVLILNGQSSTLPAPSVAAPAAGFVLFGSTITANAGASTNQGFVVGGQTLAVGGTITLDSGPSATTLALQTDAAGNSILVSNGHSSIIPAAAAGVTSLVVNGQTITPGPVPTNSLGFVVAGQTLTLGGVITLGSGPSATTLALQTDFEGHTFIVSNGVSSKIAAPTSRIDPLTIDGKTISATSLPSGGTGFVIAGQTLTPGGVITLSSGPSATILSLTTDATGNTVLVSNGHTSAVSPAPITSITINGQTITANRLPTGGIGFVVSGQTLTLGGSITDSGTAYTLTTDAAGHTVLASNGHVSLLPGQAPAGALTINGQVFMPTSLSSAKGTGYIINGQTLTVGGAVTISGTAYALTTDSDGRTVLVSDGHTLMIPDSAAASTTGRFVPVRSSTGLGPDATATATSSVEKVSLGYRSVSEPGAFEFSLVLLLMVGLLVGIL